MCDVAGILHRGIASNVKFMYSSASSLDVGDPQRQNYLSPGTCFEQLCVFLPTQVYKQLQGAAMDSQVSPIIDKYLHIIF